MTIIWHPSKKAAVKEILDLGFVPGQFEDENGTGHEGESGDHGVGSRLYFMLVEGGYNEHGVALVHATASRVGREWATSYFGLDIEEDA